MIDQNLQAHLAEVITLWGGNLFGVADLTPYSRELAQEYGAAWEDYPRGITVGVYFPRGVIQQLLDAPTHTYQTYYDALNARLNDIAFRITTYLEGEGYRAFPIPASQRVGKYKESAIFSHRLAAYRGGLGWIGKSCSLITPTVGPRLRLVTVLTDAPLEPGQPMTKSCPPNCTKCQDACPANAIKGVAYADGQELSERLDFLECAAYLRQVRQSFGKEICGKCLAACPYGQGQQPKK